MVESDRSCLGFEHKARETFAFLTDLGFSEVEASATLVRYQKEGVEVDIYHGRRSYEIGAGVRCCGTRYAMSEIIRATDVEAAKQYRCLSATTLEVVADALGELGFLMKHYAAPLLEGAHQICFKLRKQRKQWCEEYALDVLASQVRPQAEEAFRRGDYATAANLYATIRERLTPAESKKLKLAERRCAGG